MIDWQNLMAMMFVAVAAAYVLRAVCAACGLVRLKRTGNGCGACSNCPGVNAPAIVPLQSLSRREGHGN